MYGAGAIVKTEEEESAIWQETRRRYPQIQQIVNHMCSLHIDREIINTFEFDLVARLSVEDTFMLPIDTQDIERIQTDVLAAGGLVTTVRNGFAMNIIFDGKTYVITPINYYVFGVDRPFNEPPPYPNITLAKESRRTKNELNEIDILTKQMHDMGIPDDVVKTIYDDLYNQIVVKTLTSDQADVITVIRKNLDAVGGKLDVSQDGKVDIIMRGTHHIVQQTSRDSGMKTR
jgi:hypothetical protein